MQNTKQNAKLKVLVVEDDMIIAADISMQLSKMGYQIVGMCTRGEDALSMIGSSKPDIVLMDIILSGNMNGIDTAQQILAEYQTPLIFLTSNYDDATFQKALETKPYAFIAKPFQKSELERALKLTAQRINFDSENEGKDQRAEESDHISSLDDRLFLRSNGKMIKVAIKEILFVEADRNYCKVVTAEKTFLLSIPLNKFALNLPDKHFVRTHRSYIVNLSKIDSLHEQVEFLNLYNHQVPVSRRQRDDLIARLKLI